jgi:hypothetical protein
MKKLTFLLLLSALAVVAHPDLASSSVLPVTSNGTATDRQTREVAPFTAVTAAGSMRVVVRQGSPQRVEVDASAADQAKVETEVQDGRLRVGQRRDANKMWGSSVRFDGPVTVYVTTPTLTGVSVAGSGDLKVDGAVQAKDFKVSVAGSGNLTLSQLTAQEVETSVAGSGNITLGGRCTRNSISIAGSGNVKSQDLRTDDTSVRISGSGNASVNAAKTLTSKTSGSGDVLYSGNPQVSSSKSGSGTLRRM